MLSLKKTVSWARRQKWCQVFICNLRILIGFAFLPAGLKKILGQRFTEASNVGPFHEFMHAFYDTGELYHFVGIMQLLAAILLMTQRWAALGAALALPILFVINVFCWTTAGIPTIVTVTLMLLGTIGLLLWDYGRFTPILIAHRQDRTFTVPRVPFPRQERAWAFCGLAVLLIYFTACLLHGGVYRPKGPEYDNPAFYVLPTVALCPVVTGIFLWVTRGSSETSPHKKGGA